MLKALLPESGTDIKGHMRSEAELLAVSGYAGRPRDFESLLHVLDGEVRLITPTGPEGAAHDLRVKDLASKETSSEKRTRGSKNSPSAEKGAAVMPAVPSSERNGRRYYQLTHDYLVPSLREWLTRKQRETRRGRAELRSKSEPRSGVFARRTAFCPLPGNGLTCAC